MMDKIEWYREVLELEPSSKLFFPLARLLVEAAKESGVPDTAWFEGKQALTNHVIDGVRKGDILWVKGSHGMALETLVEAVYQQA